MQLKHIVAGICLGTVVVSAQADYVAEVGADVQTSSTKITADYNPDVTDDGNLDHEYGLVYLGRVETAGVPMREAGFLSRLSVIQLSQLNATDKLKVGGYSVGDTYKTTQSLLTTRFVISGTDVILGFEVGTQRQKDLYDTDIRGVQIGKYLDPDSALTLSYELNKVQPKQLSSADALSEKTVTLAYHQVDMSSQEQQTAFDLFARHFDNDNGFKKTELSGGVTFYPSLDFGLGGHLLLGTGSDGIYDYTSGAVSADVSYEVSDNLGLFARLQSSQEKRRSVQGNLQSDTTSFNVGFALRF